MLAGKAKNQQRKPLRHAVMLRHLLLTQSGRARMVALKLVRTG
jgi:hypothetical protein